MPCSLFGAGAPTGVSTERVLSCNTKPRMKLQVRAGQRLFSPPFATDMCLRSAQAAHPWLSADSLLISVRSAGHGERAWGWGPGREVPLAPPPGPHLPSSGERESRCGQGTSGIRLARVLAVCPGSSSLAFTVDCVQTVEGGRGDGIPPEASRSPRPRRMSSGRPGPRVGPFDSNQHNALTTGEAKPCQPGSVPDVSRRQALSSNSSRPPHVLPRRMTRTAAPARKISMAKKNEFPAMSCSGSRWRSEVFLYGHPPDGRTPEEHGGRGRQRASPAGPVGGQGQPQDRRHDPHHVVDPRDGGHDEAGRGADEHAQERRRPSVRLGRQPEPAGGGQPGAAGA